MIGQPSWRLRSACIVGDIHPGWKEQLKGHASLDLRFGIGIGAAYEWETFQMSRDLNQLVGTIDVGLGVLVKEVHFIRKPGFRAQMLHDGRKKFGRFLGGNSLLARQCGALDHRGRSTGKSFLSQKGCHGVWIPDQRFDH